MTKALPHYCTVCGKPAATARIEADNSRTWFCSEHIPDAEAKELFDELKEQGWEGDPKVTRN